MKDEKIPIRWLIPIVSVILVIGIFLGRAGWSITEIGDFVKLAPPTEAAISAQPTTADHESGEPSTTAPVISSSDSETDLLPNGEPVSPESLARLLGGEPEYWTKRGPVVWGYWDKGHNVTFRHPGDDTVISYWAGFPEPRNAEDCSIVIPENEEATRYVKCPAGTQAEIEADGLGFHLVDYTGFFQ
jgi:hypothetical protein